MFFESTVTVTPAGSDETGIFCEVPFSIVAHPHNRIIMIDLSTVNPDTYKWEMISYISLLGLNGEIEKVEVNYYWYEK